MHLASIREGSQELAVVVHPERGVARVRDLDPQMTGDLLAVIAAGAPRTAWARPRTRRRTRPSSTSTR